MTTRHLGLAACALVLVPCCGVSSGAGSDRLVSPITQLIWGHRIVYFATPRPDAPGSLGTFLLRWGGRSICQLAPIAVGPDSAVPDREPFRVACGLWSYRCGRDRLDRIKCRRSGISTLAMRNRDRFRLAAGDPFIGDQSARDNERYRQRRCKELRTLKPGQLFIQPPPIGCPPWMSSE